jgi:hypothetical protein
LHGAHIIADGVLKRFNEVFTLQWYIISLCSIISA